MDTTDRHDSNPALAELLDDAYVRPVDVETAARHLWVIHSEARRLAEEEAAEHAHDRPVTRASLASRRIPRTAVPVLMVVFLLAMSGVAVAASHDALPGDPLYGVKRGTERAQLVFARDPVVRAELQLEFARTRLDEIELIAASRPERVPELVQEITVTLDEIEQSPPEVAVAVQPVSDSIREETNQQIARLDLPEDVDAAVEVAMTSPPVTEAATTSQSASAVTSAAPEDSKTPTSGAEPKDDSTAAADGTEVAAAPTTESTSTTASPTASEDAVASEHASEADGGEPSEQDASAEPTPTASPPVFILPPNTDVGEGDVAGSEEPDGSSASPEEPSSGDSPSPGSTQSPSASPSPDESASEQTSEPDGPVVTARPQPSEGDDSGSSRTEDEEAAGESDDESAPAEEPSSSQPQPEPEPEPTGTAGGDADGDEAYQRPEDLDY